MCAHHPSKSLVALGAFWVLVTGPGVARADFIYSYNASLGTLPSAQGWTLFQDDPNHPLPTVNNGVLHQFPQVSASSAQYWFQNQVPLDLATTAYVYELDLHIISSNYINGGSAQRSGYYMVVTDQVGRAFGVGIASNGVTINTDANYNPNNGVPFTPFNSTNGYHLYRLVTGQGLGSLYIDNILFASTALGPPVDVDPLHHSRVYFADGSGVGISESELRSARFGTLTPTVVTPEPASLLMVGLGAVCVAARLRKRKVVQPVPTG